MKIAQVERGLCPSEPETASLGVEDNETTPYVSAKGTWVHNEVHEHCGAQTSGSSVGSTRRWLSFQESFPFQHSYFPKKSSMPVQCCIVGEYSRLRTQTTVYLSVAGTIPAVYAANARANYEWPVANVDGSRSRWRDGLSAYTSPHKLRAGTRTKLPTSSYQCHDSCSRTAFQQKAP